MHSPGTRIGPYTVAKPLSQGGMAVVYLADGPSGPVALKAPASPQYAAALRFESELLGQMAHPGIVRRLDAGVYDGQPWYAMPVLRAWSALADDGLTQTGDDEPEPSDAPRDTDAAGLPMDGLSALRRVCRTLAWMHGRGIVHRDLKPSNLMEGDSGVVLVDFGIAAQTSLGGRETGFFEASAVGTPGFMAPEQLQGADVDARTDLYAVGLMLFELLAGRPPFVPTARLTLKAQHLDVEPPRVASFNPDVPPALDALVARLLAKEPRDRPGYADEVGLRLEAFGAAPAMGPDARPYLYRPRFVGRDAALEQAETELSASDEGAGGVLLVRGPSGIGKTRFAQTVAGRAASAGRPVVTGRCLETPSGPLEPLREVLRTVADRCRMLPPETVADRYAHHLSVLAEVEPSLRGLGRAEPPNPTADAAQRQARLVQATLTVLHAFARSARPLFIFDDVQWADELTREVLAALTASPTLAVDASFLLLSRPTRESFVDSLAEGRRTAVLAMTPLDAEALASIVHDMTGTRDGALAPAFVDRIVEHSAGSPLITASLLEWAVQQGVLRRAEGQWSCPDPTGFQIPDALDDILAERVAALAPGAALLLGAGAVFGAVFDLRHATAIAGLDLEATADAVQELVVANVVLREGPWGLRFAHQRLQASAYAALDSAQLGAMHSQAARLLGDGGAARDVYRHHALAGEHAEAARFALVAAREALDGGMFTSARELLESMPLPVEPAQRAERCTLLAAGLSAAGLHKAAGAQAAIGLRELGRPLPTTSLGWVGRVATELLRRGWTRVSGASPSAGPADQTAAALLTLAWEGFLRTGQSLPYVGTTLMLLRVSTSLGAAGVGRTVPADLPADLPLGRWAALGGGGVALAGVALLLVLSPWLRSGTPPPAPAPVAVPSVEPVSAVSEVQLPERLRVQLDDSAWAEQLVHEVEVAGLEGVLSFVDADPHLVLTNDDGRPALRDPTRNQIVNRFRMDDAGQPLRDAVVPAALMTTLESHARNQGLLALEGVGGGQLTNQESLRIRAVRSDESTGCERGTWSEQTLNASQTLPACSAWHVEVHNAASEALYVGGVVLSGDGTRYALPAESPSVRVDAGQTVAIGADWPFTAGPPFDVEDHLLMVGTVSAPIDWRVLSDGGRRSLDSVGGADVEGLVVALVTDARGQMRRKAPSAVTDPWTTTRVPLVVPRPDGLADDFDGSPLCDSAQRCGAP